MTGEEIARRAQRLVGAPFRFRGREGIRGVDCVGLVVQAIGLESAARDYTLRGAHEARVIAALEAAGFYSPEDRSLKAGDILLMLCGPRQLHLAVACNDGAIHAHAGLGRVVWTPAPLPWPLLGHWRISGD